MDRSIIDKYLEADRQEKMAKKLKEKYRKGALEFFREFGSTDDAEYSKYKQTKLHEEQILRWVKETYPELAPAVTKEALDMEAFEEKVKAGAIDIQEMPEHCFSESEIEKIVPKGDKK
jgi:hypothetical protein